MTKRFSMACVAALLVFGLSLALPANGAQTKKPVSPRAKPLVVEEGTNTPWKVTVQVDRADATYSTGDYVVITVTSEQAGYLYLFNVDTAGNINILFPNQTQSNNQIAANTPVVIPSPGDSSFRIKVATPPSGKELIKALVMKQPAQELKPLESLVRSIKKSKQYIPPQITTLKFKRLVVEACGGNPNQAVSTDPGICNQNTTQGVPTQAPPGPPTQDQLQVSCQQDKDKIQQNNPAQFQQKMKEWCTGQIEITTVEGKTKPKGK